MANVSENDTAAASAAEHDTTIVPTTRVDVAASDDIRTDAAWGGNAAAARVFNDFAETVTQEALLICWCELKVIPPELGRFTCLQRLKFANNPSLDQLPEELSRCTALQTLCCSDTKLAAVPDWAFGLPMLAVLTFARCKLDAVALINVAEGIRRSHTLVRVNVTGNPQTTDPDVPLAFIRALRSNGTIVDLVLGDIFCVLSDPISGMEDIYAALDRNRRGDAPPEPYSPMVKASRP